MDIQCITRTLTVVQGCSLVETVTINDGDGGSINISTATFNMSGAPTLLELSDVSTHTFDLTLGTGLSIVNGAGGILGISATAAQLDTASATFGTDFDQVVSTPYCLTMTLNGVTTPVMLGALKINRGRTT